VPTVTVLRQFQIHSFLRAGFVLGAGVIGIAMTVAATSNLLKDSENFNAGLGPPQWPAAAGWGSRQRLYGEGRPEPV
jgi:hypothetical protein